MKSHRNFCIIRSLAAADGGFRAQVELIPGHPVYKGHFPERPVVPGVFTLSVVRECAAAVLGRDVEYSAIRECKFISALLPCEGLAVTLDFTLAEDGRLCGTVSRDDAVVLKLKATLR